MAKIEATRAQAQAIHSRGSTILVSAGAGSGKTRVLTERLLSYVTDPEDPQDLDRFLVITYTRAAAAELSGRILADLSAALAEDPGNRHLRRQSALCRRAQISTIHSFCASLLREYAHLAGLRPDFTVLDEDRTAAMKTVALERTLEACYDNSDAHPGFLALADTVGAGRDDHRLQDLVMDLHGKMQCHARPERWAAEQAALLAASAEDAGETSWGQEILSSACATAEYWAKEMDDCLSQIISQEKIAAAYRDSFADTADALHELRRCLDQGWEKTRSCLPVPFPKLNGLRNSPDPELSDRVKARREACKKAMEKLAEIFADSSETLLAEMRGCAPVMQALLQLVLDFDREYTRDKQRAGLADYSDLEHKTVALLTNDDGSPTPLAEQVSGRFLEIMVDEYQDVSPVQDVIFHALSRNGKNLFLVGDVKQSIYRFRLADPGLFTEKYLRFADADTAQPGQSRRILLQENFRSRREILDAANTVFSLCMSRSLGELDYDEAAALKPGAVFPGEVPVPELLLLHLPESSDEEAPDKTDLEAAFVARKIRELLQSGASVTEQGHSRPLRPGDIAILLRTANTVGGAFRRALIREGLPVSSGQGGGFYQAEEISTVVSMLALLDNPHQDIPLIAVLRSPAFGFSADALSRIRAADKDSDFYTALCISAEQDSACRSFLDRLEFLRRQAPDLNAAELVWLLLEEFDLIALCSAMSDGAQRRVRLMELISLAETFERSGYRGLHRFVLWLRRQAERDQEPVLGAETGSAVQILSIHKSKGLEFPVVFLSNMGHRFNTRDSTGTVLVHPELGLGPKVTDSERRAEYPSLARNAISQRILRESYSEEMRVLYVGMTRPKERLFITAALKDPEKVIEKEALTVSHPLAPEVLRKAAAPVNWLISAVLADGQTHLRIRIEELPESGQTAEPDISSLPVDENAVLELTRRLAFRYPHPEAQSLPSKVTPTELKGRGDPDGEAQSLAPKLHRAFRMPDFFRETKPVSGTEKGTATHLVLQLIDLDKTGSVEAVTQEISRLQEQQFLSAREAYAVDTGAIVKLFASPLGHRIRQADTVRREFRFSLMTDASDFFDVPPGEELLLQGSVDCFLEEGGALTVIDYKTDRLKNRKEAVERAELYRNQIQAYARALKRICSMPVKECLLYFLSVGETIAVPVDE